MKLVAGSNRVDSLMSKSSSLIARNTSIRALLVIVAVNNINIRVGDIKNTYIWAACSEKV